mgnify:CR=1 FL=1
MNKVIKLTKIFLKNSFSNMDARMGISTKSKSKIIIYGLLFLYFAGLIIFLGYNLLDGLIAIHQETIFVGMVLFMIFGLATVQTIFSSINILYFTKDSEYLLPLPLKPYQIILARTNVMLIAEYLIIFLVGFIPLLMYGILTGAGIIYYLTMIFAVILLPILPVLLISMLVMFIMSFAKLTKNRNKFQLFAMLLILAIIMAISISTSGMKQDLTNEEMAQMVVQANGMIELVKGYIPTVDYLMEALTTNSLFTAIVEVLKTLGITIIGFIVYMLIAQKIYFKGLVGNLFGGGASSSNKEINQKEYRNSKLYKSYVGKEFKNMARNPVFLMQCLIPAVLIPIIMVVVVFAGFNSDGMGLEQITQMAQQMPTNTFFIACIILGVIQFFTMFIYVSITAVSRDGENAVFMKYIPVSLYKQYIYKIIPNIIMNIVTILVTLGMAEYLLNLPVITLIALFVVATIMGILQSIAMIIVDLKRPKLNWDSEYAVAKQNLNLVFPVLLSMINIAILVGFVYLLKDINVYIGVGILGILYVMATFITNKYLYNKQYELAEKII